MSKRPRDLVAWLDARHPRERVLLLAGSAAVLFGLWNLGLMGPLREKTKAVDVSVREVEQQIRLLQGQGEQILLANSADPNGELREREAALSRQIEALDARIHEHTVTLIPPKEMARFLEELLGEETDLRLVHLENLSPEPMLDDPQRPSGADRPGGADGPSSGLFKHGFVIELRGGYLSTLRYLRALEALPWNFFWEGLEYQVEEFPEGKVVIRAYTVSADEVWVGV